MAPVFVSARFLAGVVRPDRPSADLHFLRITWLRKFWFLAKGGFFSLNLGLGFDYIPHLKFTVLISQETGMDGCFAR
jgi:hypothetical protein